jgi:hypothetical protein
MIEPLIKYCMGKALVERSLLLERIAVIMQQDEAEGMQELLKQLRDEVDPDHQYIYSEKKWNYK